MKKLERVAIIYDRVNKFGGAERVLLALRSLYPNSVLYTSVYDKEGASWVGDWEVRTSFLQYIPFAKKHHEWFALFMPLAFISLDVSGFDLVISVTSEFAKNIRTTDKQTHVCYCLTPIRYLWSHTHEYGGGVWSWAKQCAFSFLRMVDRQAARRPDAFIAISERVKKRIETYYQRNVDAVVYPPTVVSTSKTSATKERSYYLAVSRLVPYKRVDLAIRACMKMSRDLRIVGTGSDERRLRKVAGSSPFVHFEGNVADDELPTLYQRARALLCPQEEDFGLVSVEAQSYGVPVLSYKESGVAETVIDEKTGILFTSQVIESVTSAMKKCETTQWNHIFIAQHAHDFDQPTFARKFVAQVDAVQLGKKRRKDLYE